MHLETSITLSAPFNMTEAQLQAHLASHTIRNSCLTIRQWRQLRSRRRPGLGQPAPPLGWNHFHPARRRRQTNPQLAAIAAAMLRANQP